jgi:hypothetical protein
MDRSASLIVDEWMWIALPQIETARTRAHGRDRTPPGSINA